MPEIFRFVTVRNPRKPTEQELSTGFIFYDEKVKAPLIAQVAAAKRKPSPRSKMRAALQQYVESPAYINDLDKFQRQMRAMLIWLDWLPAEASQLTKGKVDSFRSEHELTIDQETHQKLWDNLVAYTYFGGASEVREALIWGLRVVNLLRYPKSQLKDAILPRLAQATVVLPSDVHLPPEHPDHGGMEVPPHSPGASDPGKTRREKLDALQMAHKELNTLYRAAIERARAEEVSPPVMPRIVHGCVHMPELATGTARRPDQPHVFGVLHESLLGQLTSTTQRVLRDVGVEPGSRVPYALNKIENAVTAEAKAASTQFKASTKVVYAGGAFWTSPSETITMLPHLPPPVDEPRNDREYSGLYDDEACKVKPIGIADFRRVEQEIWCYEPGEVAHIENVLKGESKERVTRRLRRSEEILTVASEEEKTEERDAQTTDRFEVEKEAEKIVQTDISFELGVQLTAQYGPVKIQADTKFAISNSTKESDKTASKYAREVTDRALQRVITKTREERITKLIEEFEETNKHGLDNTDPGTEHTVGLYRWVDKIYLAKIVNYGKRLMFEFLVPEPAAFHLFAMSETPIESSLPLEKPLHPNSQEAADALGLSRLTSHKDIDPTNYAIWAAAYDAAIDPMPTEYVTVSKAFHREGMNHDIQFADSKNELKLPDGYEGYWFNAQFGLHSEDHDGPNWITIFVGRQNTFQTQGGAFSGSLDGEDDFVPINVMGRTRFYALDVEIDCHRTKVAEERWQIKTYQAIIKAYDDKLAAYMNALAQAKARAGVEIAGTNPLRNREVERTELKKWCIRLLWPKCNPLWSNAMKDKQECGYPEFDCCEAIKDGRYVEFIEQAFEWKLMTYLFYPYFWGRKCNWQKIYQIDNADPLFLGFLQAGFARVVVPAREGYEEAATRFLADGQPWNGGSVPGIESDLYLSIANEMKEPVGVVDPTVEPWEIRLPTTLTVLQCDSGCVEGKGLPCRRDEEHP
jgi:hypothetical protein